jgi:hypothetical protein
VRESCLIDGGAVSGGGGILRIVRARSARQRGTTVPALAQRVLHTVLPDGLLDAVLDDGKDSNGAIARLPRNVRDYIAGFNLAALAVTDNGIRLTRDPAGARAAWWCRAADAAPLHEWLTEHQSCDVLYAARQLQVSVTPHAIVVQRASAALGRIDAGCDKAQEAGLLKEFNAQYKRCRLLAKARGQGFLPYRHAKARLRKMLVTAVATGGLPENLFDRVFDAP